MCTVVYISPKFALHKLYLFLYLCADAITGGPKLQSLVYIKAALLALKYKRHRRSDYTYPNIWQNGLSPGNIICNWSWYTATDILVIKGDINHVFYLKQLGFFNTLKYRFQNHYDNVTNGFCFFPRCPTRLLWEYVSLMCGYGKVDCFTAAASENRGSGLTFFCTKAPHETADFGQASEAA